MRVLITGSSGFLASSIITKLIDNGHHVNYFTRDNSMSELISLIKNSDYCFHLAGEVNPKASPVDFNDSNVNLTRELVKYLQVYNPIPIIFSSTIHAGQANNDYGNSKLLAERLVSDYGIANAVATHIYRLPHLFGVGAKEHYNSVFTTWVFNVLRGEELIIFDGDVVMSYIQVDELSHVFNQQLGSIRTLDLPPTYKISLTDLKIKIQEISRLLDEQIGYENKFDSYVFDMLQDAKRRIKKSAQISN